jgi:hypothetical protein
VRWHKKECIDEFRISLLRQDGRGIEGAMRGLDQLHCWREAFSTLLTGSSPDETIGSSLLWFWVTYGPHIASSLKGDLILVDALKRHLFPYAGPALTLYRGELLSRYNGGSYGLSWTPFIEVATMFADRRVPLGEGQGVILEVEATPDMIVACVPQTSSGGHTSWLQEYEYILDPRSVRGVRARQATFPSRFTGR